MVKTWPSNAGGCVCVQSLVGELRSSIVRSQKAKAKQKQCCNKFIKTLKIAHIKKIYICIHQASSHETECYFLPKHSWIWGKLYELEAIGYFVLGICLPCSVSTDSRRRLLPSLTNSSSYVGINKGHSPDTNCQRPPNLMRIVLNSLCRNWNNRDLDPWSTWERGRLPPGHAGPLCALPCKCVYTRISSPDNYLGFDLETE